MRADVNNRLKRNKTWVIFGIALCIGLLAALAARSYLSTRIEAIEARGKGSTVKLLVAKRELKRGDKVSSDTVAVRDVPVDFAHSGAISPETFDRVDGQPLGYPVRAGELILWSLMEGKKAPTFSARVEIGRRAMTVAVDEISSISGMLEPGDLIDLLVTVDKKGRKITRPLLQKVQVMATGQRSVDTPRDGERRQYSTVTIDITPAQAEQVILARDAGKVTALLRNPGDHNGIAGGNADMVRLLGAGKDGSRMNADPERGVPVLYGGSARFAPEALVMGSSAAQPVGVAESDDAGLSGSLASTVPVMTASRRLAGQPAR
jgi:pilus assembly protein CpaB